MTADLDAVRAALSAATPGPWEWRYGMVANPPITYGWRRVTIDDDPEGDMSEWEPDAHLIAHAPEWLAALADEVEALRAKLARVEALADDYQHLPPGVFHGADAARELRHALTD